MLDRPVDEVDRDYALDPEAPEVTFDRGDKAIARAKAALATSDLARAPRRRRAGAAASPARPDDAGSRSTRPSTSASAPRSTARCAAATSR